MSLQLTRTPQPRPQDLPVHPLLRAVRGRGRGGERRRKLGSTYLLYTHHTTHVASIRAPCFSLALAAEQMAQMPLTRPGLPAGRQRGARFPQSPRAGTCRSDQQASCAHSRLLSTCRCGVYVWRLCVRFPEWTETGTRRTGRPLAAPPLKRPILKRG